MQQISDLDIWLSSMFRCVDNYFFEHPEIQVYHFKIPDRFRAVWDEAYLVDRITSIGFDSDPELQIPDYSAFIRPRNQDTELWVTATTTDNASTWNEDNGGPEPYPLGFNPTVIH